MESVIRGVVVYVFVLLVFRIAGKRTLSQTSEFELVLLLIIGETVQDALIDGDHSLTNAFVLIATLIGMSIALTVVRQRWPGVSRWLDGLPVVVVRKGGTVQEVMQAERVDEADILAAGRATHGLSRIDEIEHAVVEENGEITVIPKRGEEAKGNGGS